MSNHSGPIPLGHKSGLTTFLEKPSHHDNETPALPHGLGKEFYLIKNRLGKYFAVINRKETNSYALPIRSKQLNAIIMEHAALKGITLRKGELLELNERLEAYAEQYGQTRDVWLRIAPIDKGIEVDLGDDRFAHVRITAGAVEMVTSDSEVLFSRTAHTKAMPVPATHGNFELLKKFLNVSPADFSLLIAWITYTLAHPKTEVSKYVILIVQGSEGSGKSNLCKTLIRLIDPNALGVQIFPQNAKDLAIAGQNAHVLCFDNLRHLKANMADMLCVAATGGTITSRQLYTDAEQQATPLHVALILNGIHQFIEQPDLAQRCLPINLKPIPATERKSEEQFAAELEADMPAIMRGLFDLIANIFKHKTDAEITRSERMIDFVRWLAAMEKVRCVPIGVLQDQYSYELQQGQLDALMNNSLAAAIIEFVDTINDERWSDTPSGLLAELNARTSRNTQNSRDWPQNAIAFSKRIAGLQAGLLSQGIRIELSRGKHRTVTLSKVAE